MIIFVGIVELFGAVLYRRRFFIERDAMRWFSKRGRLMLEAPRDGEVVSLRDADGRLVAEWRSEEIGDGRFGAPVVRRPDEVAPGENVPGRGRPIDLR